jgi:hypothetical protein
MLMRRAAAFAKSGSEQEVEEGYPESGDPCAALEKKVQFGVTFARTVRVRSATIEGKRGHFHGHEHTCTLTRRQSEQTPTLATPESKPDTCRRVCAVYHARTTTSSHTPRPQRARKIARSGRHPGSTAENATAVRGNPAGVLPPAFACRGSR